MNYKTIDKSKFSLINYIISKAITHNKSSLNSLTYSKYFTKAWHSISSVLFDDIEYNNYQNRMNFKPYGSNYNIKDTTELRFMASRRSFL